MNKDQRLLEEIYSKIVSENIKEPEFVKNKPHLPTIKSPQEGDIGAMKLVSKHPDQLEEYTKAAEKLLKAEIEKKKYNINFTVLKRDNFGNLALDEYKDAVMWIVKYMQNKKDDVDGIHKLVQDLASRLSQVTNRYDYNSDKKISNLASMHNDNAKPVHAGNQFPSESTLNYLSASFNKNNNTIINENNNQETKNNSTLKYLGKDK